MTGLCVAGTGVAVFCGTAVMYNVLVLLGGVKIAVGVSDRGSQDTSGVGETGVWRASDESKTPGAMDALRGADESKTQAVTVGEDVGTAEADGVVLVVAVGAVVVTGVEVVIFFLGINTLHTRFLV